MKPAKNIIAIFILLLGFGLVKGQSLNTGSRIVDAKIDLKGVQVKGAYVVIEYEIPYSGMVEIRLFDKQGDKIWQNQYPDKYGENKIVLKASKFNPGETYTYALNYKRDEVKEDFVIPPMGFD